MLVAPANNFHLSVQVEDIDEDETECILANLIYEVSY